MTYNRGDVVLVLFPDSSLRTAKRRPVLVVQASSLATRIPQTIVAMITTNTARAGHPSRVFFPFASPISTGTGLRSDSIVVTDNLATVLDIEIDRKIGAIADMSSIDAALRHTLAL